MPPVIAVFIALSIFAHGHTMVTGRGAIWKGVDHEISLKTSKTPIRYNVWTSPRWGGVADQETKLCTIRFFATVTGGGVVRLNADGVEQLINSSWVFDRTTRVNSKLTKHFWFLNPIGGEILSYVERDFTCFAAYDRPQHHWEMR